MIPSLFRYLLLGLFISMMIWPASPLKAAAPISVRGGAHADHDRIVFDFSKKPISNITNDKGNVEITFEGLMPFDLKGLQTSNLQRLKNWQARQDNNKTIISFNVHETTRVKNFYSGSFLVIDLEGPSSETVAAPPSPTPSSPPSNNPVVEATPTETPAPSPPVQEATPITNPESVNLPEATVAAAPTPEIATPETGPNIAATTDLATKENTAEQIETETSQSTDKAAQIVAASDDFVPSVDPIEIVRFATPQDTGAAIYSRGGFVTILFDQKLMTPLRDLVASMPPKITIEEIPFGRQSAFRFRQPPGTHVRANQDQNGWHIYLSTEPRAFSVSMAFIAEPDYAFGPRLVLPLSYKTTPTRFQDPVVGDTLIIVPFKETGQAFTQNRVFAEFEILPAIQGLLIRPADEKIKISTNDTGLSIEAEGGLRLSGAEDIGLQYKKVTDAPDGAKGLFNFAAWAGRRGENFTESRQRLMQAIVNKPVRERVQARIDLAKLYFAHGFGKEALALLLVIEKGLNGVRPEKDFMALLGAAHILAGNSAEGFDILEDPELTYIPEVKLWKAIAAADQRDWGDAFKRFVESIEAMTYMPEPLYSRFMILAIEAAIANERYTEAALWITDVDKRQNRWWASKPALDYLRGILENKANRDEMAKRYWKMTKESRDKLYRTRAELALIDLAVYHKELTAKKAAKRLEAMRFAWRGDELEIDILYRLGRFYLDDKNTKAALSSFGDAVRLYPEGPLTDRVRLDMQEAFNSIFMGDTAKKFSAVEALSIYQEFRTMVPDSIIGEQIIDNLVMRLVKMDLLPQAVGLLEKQLVGITDPAAKATLGTRIAGLYLLDQKADSALKALQDSVIENLPADLAAERLLLRARALLDKNQFDEARSLLLASDTDAARRLRVDVAWKSGAWAEAAELLNGIIGAPPKDTETIPAEIAGLVINRAVALALSGNSPALEQLAIDFSPSMQKSPQKINFELLTKPENIGQLKDVAAAQSEIADVDLFRNFLNNYRSGNAENPAPNPGP
jgi:outer membrane protein assembly factor BamD (BamD/ComL family)